MHAFGLLSFQDAASDVLNERERFLALDDDRKDPRVEKCNVNKKTSWQ